MSGREQGQEQGQPVVGPDLHGTKEVFRLEQKLMTGLFGGVYEAKGLTSGKAFAVKVLMKTEIQKASQADATEFCEVPLREIVFQKQMSDHDHVMEVKDHFEDDYCHYIVFELAPGGDLLEALKIRPTGFEEHQAQFLILQAAKGLSALHQRGVAMQDVSLENMLIAYLEDGQYQIKIIDPGQATTFETDESGEELAVQFKGFVAKSFRPPELQRQRPYLASKVDAWCLGWSTFYLLAAQPLFLSASAADQDPDWLMFQRGEVKELFSAKGVKCSEKCLDFILALMDLDPRRRMSVTQALSHRWLADPSVRPMYRRAAEPPQASFASPPKTKYSPGSVVTQGGPSGGSRQNGSHSGVQPLAGRGSSLSPGPDASRAGCVRQTQLNGRGTQPLLSSAATATPSAAGRAPSRQAPSWKMAPSRADSPPPGPSNTRSALAFRQPQVVPRHASPLGGGGAAAAREENNSRQTTRLATPRQPDQSTGRGIASLRGSTVAGTGSAAAPQTSSPAHHPEPISSVGGHQPRTAGQYSLPTPTATARGPEGANSPAGGYSTSTAVGGTTLGGSASNASSAQGLASGDGATAVASRNASGRQQQLGAFGDAGHVPTATGGMSSPGGLASGASGGQRTSSPIPQAPFVIRAGNTRGYSPGPLATQAQASQLRTGSPVKHGSTGVPAVIGGASRSAVSGSAVIESGSGGHYWQSPRPSSPSTLVWSNEVFTRGRSATRSGSPSQVTAHSPPPSAITFHNNPPSPQLMRAVSPGVVASVPSRASGAGGLTWNPAPVSPMPKGRSVSPVPQPVVLNGSPVPNPVPKWVA